MVVCHSRHCISIYTYPRAPWTQVPAWFLLAVSGKTVGVFVDNFLCFGLAIASAIFQRFSTAIVRMMQRRGFVIVSYLDDFIVTADNFESCEHARCTLIALLTSLGFAVRFVKVQGPAKRVKCLELILDSPLRRIELPADRFATLACTATVFSTRTKITKRQLQRFAGLAAFAARALSRDVWLTYDLKLPRHRTTVIVALTQEFMWWDRLATEMNGLVPCNWNVHHKRFVITSVPLLAALSRYVSQMAGRHMR